MFETIRFLLIPVPLPSMPALPSWLLKFVEFHCLRRSDFRNRHAFWKAMHCDNIHKNLHGQPECFLLNAWLYLLFSTSKVFVGVIEDEVSMSVCSQRVAAIED
jgi:hypothetical protein